jgi:hypothetical protein
MRFDFSCPWCGADTSMRGSDQSGWRAQIPCELCSRDMVVSFDGSTLISRRVDGPLSQGREETVRIRRAR